MNEADTQEMADTMRRTSAAVLQALEREGDQPAVCLGALGAVVGALCVAMDDPEEALGIVTNLARGIIDGTLVTKT